MVVFNNCLPKLLIILTIGFHELDEVLSHQDDLAGKNACSWAGEIAQWLACCSGRGPGFGFHHPYGAAAHNGLSL